MMLTKVKKFWEWLNQKGTPLWVVILLGFIGFGWNYYDFNQKLVDQQHAEIRKVLSEFEASSTKLREDFALFTTKAFIEKSEDALSVRKVIPSIQKHYFKSQEFEKFLSGQDLDALVRYQESLSELRRSIIGVTDVTSFKSVYESMQSVLRKHDQLIDELKNKAGFGASEKPITS